MSSEPFDAEAGVGGASKIIEVTEDEDGAVGGSNYTYSYVGV